MVHINVWFTARSRSTALLRSLSQIPESKVFFETLLWAHYIGDEDSVYTRNPEQLPPKTKEHVEPGYNLKTALKRLQDCDAKVRILKDFVRVLNGKYDDVITKDSVNVFLVRDPKLTFTSFLPNVQAPFYFISKQSEPDTTLHYKEVLKAVDYVEKNCNIAPLVIDSSIMSTVEGATKVVKTICEKAGVEFNDSLLSWKAFEGLDPDWVAPKAATTTNQVMGFFLKANESTCFEDLKKEREVNLDDYREKMPNMVEDIELCTPIYQQIIASPYTLK